MAKTLCKRIKAKDQKKDFEKYCELVAQAEYVCCNCGRAAAKEKHLCKPKSLKKD